MLTRDVFIIYMFIGSYAFCKFCLWIKKKINDVDYMNEFSISKDLNYHFVISLLHCEINKSFL